MLSGVRSSTKVPVLLLLIVAWLVSPFYGLQAWAVPAASVAPVAKPVAAAAGISGFSGFPHEWDVIEAYNSYESGGALARLQAVQRGSRLFLNLKGSGLLAGGTFYLDSDNSVHTGTALPTWGNSTGIDYKINGSTLYKWANGGWQQAAGIDIHASDTFIEASVRLTDLGLSSSGPIRVGYAKSASEELPQYGQPMLETAAAPPEVYGPGAAVIVDGSGAEWGGISPAAVSGDALTQLYGSISGGTLYVMIKGQLGDYNDVFVDTDNDAGTGYAYSGWPGFGGDYLIENGKLYKSGGSGWNWTSMPSGTVAYAAAGSGALQTAELSIPLQTIGMSSSGSVRITFKAGNILVPERKGAPGVVKPSLPAVTVDGNGTEWAGLPPIASGQGVVGHVYGFVRNNVLSVLADGTNISSANFIRLFIDSDDQPSTGYQDSRYAESGADYLVENGRVYTSTGSGWAWNRIGTAQSVVSSVYAQPGKQLLEMSVDMSGWSPATDQVHVALRVGSDYAPASGTGGYAPVTSKYGAMIVVDGSESDWEMLDDVATVQPSPMKMRAVQDQSKLYMLVEGKEMNTQNAVYIDADRSGATGWASPIWPGAGIDYKVEYNSLYRYEPVSGVGGSSWVKTGPVFVYVTADYVLMYLYLEDIGLSAPGPIHLGYMSKQNVSLPDSGTPMLTVNTVFAAERLSDTFYPKESFQVLNNPFVGWTTRGSSGDRPQPHSLLYAGVTWKELEPQKGIFDWSAMESKFQFDYWRSKGKRFVLRIVLDDPTEDPAHKDIPDWLYDELVVAEGEPNAGRWYSSPSRKGFSPNYNSPVLIAEHARLIEALAAKYDQDPIVAFIQIGSLGHWGEFHNSPEAEAGKFPNVSVSDQYVQHYLDAFQHTLIGMRKPYPIAAQNRLGLFNDVFADRGSTESWLDWIDNGWKGIKSYVDPNQDPDAVQAASKMPDFWKNNFSGGEFANSNSLQALQDGTVMETLRQARLSHTSWLGPSSPVSLRPGIDIQDDVQANIDMLHKTIGYRFVLESVTAASEAAAGNVLTISAAWSNKGTAPFYYKWPIAYALADAKGNLVSSSVTPDAVTDIRSWLPGRASQTAEVAIPSTVPRGTYTLLAGILDPDTGKPGASIAIDGGRADGWHPLQTVMITNPADVPPTMPTNLRAAGQTNNSVALVWNEAYDETGVAGYDVNIDGVLAASTVSPSYTATGLTGDTSYTFTVKAYDAGDKRSDGVTLTVRTDGGNRLANGGFETYTGSSGVADGWTVNNSSSITGADFQVVTASVYSGGKAQRLAGTNIAGGARVSVRQTITVEPNKAFMVSGHVYAPELSQAKVQLYVDFLDGNGQVAANAFVDRTEPTAAYVPLELSGTVPATAVKVHVYAILRGTGTAGSGTVYADDLSFRYEPSAPPLLP